MVIENKQKSRVLAKSAPEITLKQHIDDCLIIWKQLQQCVPNLPIDNHELFWQMLRTCIIFHDMGKAHREFQKLLRKMHNEWYGQRHELFSLYFINESNLNDYQKELVSFSISGHHKDLPTLFDFAYTNYRNDDDSESNLSFDDECIKIDINTIWHIAEGFGYKRIPQKNIDIYKL